MTSLAPQWPYKSWFHIRHPPTKMLSSLCQNNLSTQSKHSSLTENLEWQIARLRCLITQLTWIIPSVITKTGHCSLPISALQTRSAFNCICPGKILFPYTSTLAESLSSSLCYFPSWSCWHPLVVEISIIAGIGEDLEHEVAVCENITLRSFYPLSETQFAEGRQIKASYICAVWRGFTLGLVEYAIIRACLDVRLAVLLAGKELYPNLSLSLKFIPVSKSRSQCHHHKKRRIPILNLTNDVAKRLFLTKLSAITCRDNMVNRANQDWLADKELRYWLMLLFLFLSMGIRYVWRLVLYLKDDK